jgi:hypothetical protein
MGLLHKLNNLNRPARMTRRRVAFVMIVAVVADALQFWLGPLGWIGAVQVIDVATMIITTLVIGFHILLLPTFLVEFFPVVSAIPTWTGCVIAVLALRGKQQKDDGFEHSVSELPPPGPQASLPQPPIISSVPPGAKSGSPPNSGD